METTNINQFKINVLTQEQYNNAEKDENQIYLITDNVANYLALTGGQMTGEIILHGDPTNALGAATKQYVDNELGNKVDIVSGKGLSTNDYTTEEKTKLAGIATGATANTGTITAVQANGTSVATSGTANIPAASTSKYGVTKLSSVTNSTSTSLAATASAVKAAYDLANGKANASHTQAASTITDFTSAVQNVLAGYTFANIETGSYTGTGTEDASITFSFVPKLVMVGLATIGFEVNSIPTSSQSGNPSYTGLLNEGFIWYGQQKIPIAVRPNNYRLQYCNIILSGTTLSWASGGSGWMPFNKSDTQYLYIAIG